MKLTKDQEAALRYAEVDKGIDHTNIQLAAFAAGCKYAREQLNAACNETIGDGPADSLNQLKYRIISTFDSLRNLCSEMDVSLEPPHAQRRHKHRTWTSVMNSDTTKEIDDVLTHRIANDTRFNQALSKLTPEDAQILGVLL